MSLNRDWDLVEFPEQPPVTTSERQTTVSEKSATVISNVSSGTDTVTRDEIEEKMRELQEANRKLSEDHNKLEKEYNSLDDDWNSLVYENRAREEKRKRASLKIDDETRRKKQKENYGFLAFSLLIFAAIGIIFFGGNQPSGLKNSTVISNASTGVDTVTLDEIRKEMKELLHEEVRALTEELRNQYNSKAGENFSVQEEAIKRALVSHKQDEKRKEEEENRAAAPYIFLFLIFFFGLMFVYAWYDEQKRRKV